MAFQDGEPLMVCRSQDMRGCRQMRRRRGGTGRRGTQRASSKAAKVFPGIAEALPHGTLAAPVSKHKYELAKERNVKVSTGQGIDQVKTPEEKFDCVDNAHETKGKTDPTVTSPVLDRDEAAAAAARVLLARIRSRLAGSPASGGVWVHSDACAMEPPNEAGLSATRSGQNTATQACHLRPGCIYRTRCDSLF